ncbi:ShlB/FhaC/HecB family hemolysin secretion/activation protein [Rhizobium oryzicola]|uniref:ShlB/FhaC/HecB family hemolysin secretion/activation protein n=1 Tax=Rhizobium oryzicola TaxID=1232668 RepID=A0ABT8T0Q2_9HYPH|nr:ShlB/FhaC/HecB family hemolysin secretion/activation protein [Rhizobium oryzicola]MDO1583462.1 ShlB/FhaC/HecB family hemolysin secretion/activation protein [Rhizobium oryzicola]
MTALLAVATVPMQKAHAQTASQVVAPSYAPPVVRPVEGGMSLDGATGLDAPKDAEKLSVTPSGLVVEGGRAELLAETAKVEAALKGRRVTGADLFAAARQLEEAYAKAGYLLVRVSLPPQTVKNGRPLRLVVTDGQVEAIDASALPEHVRGRINDVLAPLVGKTGLTKAELERRLLLAGDTPGVMLKSTLKAGSKPGGTVIVVDGRYDAVTATLTMDNSLADNLGRYVMGVGADFNSLLGMGEVGYLRLNGYPGFNDNVFDEDPRNRQIIAGFTLPLGTDGFWLNMEGVDSRTHPKSDLAYTMEDHYQRLSTKLGYSWIRAREANTSSVLSFDVTEEKQKLNLSGATTPFTQDQLRVLRFTQTGDMITAWGGQFSGSLTASFGLDGLGARSGTTDLPMSRSGAEPDFQKLEISATYGQSFLAERMHLSVSGKAQTSFGEALASSEQFGLGGADWLSAFDSGKMQGDAGAAFRAELSFPVTLPQSLGLGNAFGSAVAPYLFGAAGIAKLEQPTAAEEEITRASAFGAGIRVGLSEKASPHSATLTLEYAHGESSSLDSQNRFNMRFIARF